MSIGLASSYGKIWIHSSGTSTRFEDVFTADHDSFLESMADADRSVMDYMGRENIVYINVANRLSVDCDCDAHPHDPEMGDIGIFASADPVALDQACVDAVYASEDDGKACLLYTSCFKQNPSEDAGSGFFGKPFNFYVHFT